MRRREFIASLCGVAIAWPLAAGAQQRDKLATVAVLGDHASMWDPWTGAFAGRMRELGWIEGRNVTIEYHWSEDATNGSSRSRGISCGKMSTLLLPMEAPPPR